MGCLLASWQILLRFLFASNSNYLHTWENFGITVNILLNQDWIVRTMNISNLALFLRKWVTKMWNCECKKFSQWLGGWSASYSKQELFLYTFFDLWDFICGVAFTAILRWDGDTGYYVMSCVCIKCQLDFLSILNFKHGGRPIYRENFGCHLWTSLSISNRVYACLVRLCPTMILK